MIKQKLKNYVKVHLTIWLVLGQFNNLSAQIPEIHEFESRLDAQFIDDSLKYNHLIRLTKLYKDIDLESALSKGIQALDIAEKLDDNERRAEIIVMIGDVYKKHEKHIDATAHYSKAAELYLEIGDSLNMVECLLDISVVLWKGGHYENVLNRTNQIKDICEEQEYNLQLAKCLNIIGLTYNNLWLVRKSESDYRLGQKSFASALTLYEQIGYSRGKASVLHNLGILEAKVGHYNLALEYYKKSLQICKSQGNRLLTSENLIFMAQTFGCLNRTKEAIDFAEQGLTSYQELGQERKISRSLRILAGIYYDIAQYEKAIQLAKKALSIGQSLNALPLVKEASEILYRSYEDMDNELMAFKYLKVHLSAKDSLLSTERAADLTKLNSDYSTKQKQLDNEVLRGERDSRQLQIDRHRQIIIASAIALAILILIVAIVLRAWRTQRKLFNKIESLNESQNRWFTNIAHELRTPVTLILGPISHFINRYGDTLDKSALANMLLIEKNCTRLMKLIGEVLEYYKFECGQAHKEDRVISIQKLINNIVDYFIPAFKEKEIHCELKLPPESFCLKTDGRKVESILVNLLCNALKFTDKFGKIEVVFEELNESINISIIDSGRGIRQEDLDNIFEPYYQAKIETNLPTGQAGTGIGLALSREMARILEGEIKVFSKFGMGSKFTLQLPSSLKCDETVMPSEANESSVIDSLPSNIIHENLESKHFSGQHILLVEDNKDMQEYISSILSLNYNVSIANDGITALKMLARDTEGNRPINPDLVVSDVLMPWMDGFTFFQKFKELYPEHRIPFVILTARSELEDKLKALELGVSDYIIKPFCQEELLARIRNLLANSSTPKEHSSITVPSGVVLTDNESLPPSYAEDLLNRIKQEVETHMRDSQLSVDSLAETVGMHKKTLTRTLKRALGLTPGKFIREMRLRRALRYLESGTFPTVNEVAHAVGFESSSNFTHAFYQRYGKKPSEYMQKPS